VFSREAETAPPETWWSRFGILAAGLVVLVVLGVVHDAYVSFIRVPEPEGWTDWPDVRGYETVYDVGGCFGHGAVCNWENVYVVEMFALLSGGVSLGSLYGQSATSGPLPRVHASGSVRTVSISSAGTPRFVAAFDASKTTGAVRFRHDRTRLAIESCAGALALLVAFALYGRRFTLGMRRFEDPTRFRPGTLSSGTIAFADGTPPLTLGDAEAVRLPAGPVLVGVEAVEAGTYRVAANTRASVIVPGDAEAVVGAREARLARLMRTTFWTAMLIFVGTLASMSGDACHRFGDDSAESSGFGIRR
jgi:hypothetical protein